ncbi:DDE-type integrase/transposase/recombinase [Rhodococcus jostii]|uniref:DDE-type integrase/transposase/recombinase n=1 Tax=Rhodococcus jostii TaxID=132919 RepID=UPI00363BF34A
MTWTRRTWWGHNLRRTGEGWLYLASVLDLGSRNLPGYAMADHMRTDLIGDALTMAVGIRGGQMNGIVFHSDRGSTGPPTTSRNSPILGYGNQ